MSEYFTLFISVLYNIYKWIFTGVIGWFPPPWSFRFWVERVIYLFSIMFIKLNLFFCGNNISKTLFYSELTHFNFNKLTLGIGKVEDNIHSQNSPNFFYIKRDILYLFHLFRSKNDLNHWLLQKFFVNQFIVWKFFTDGTLLRSFSVFPINM